MTLAKDKMNDTHINKRKDDGERSDEEGYAKAQPAVVE
jgi:hypothetical protein